MAIQKLAETVSRLIGAAQVLSDPSAVIKELVDNALDAHATSIAIEISSNTLDVLQVRDNGHGILPDDRLLVARPNTTSKLTDIEDLKSLGGTSLGFRGQALAAAAEMSGSLTISTRVEGEQVATALKIDHQGEVTGQERTSLPIGTTVKITDFMKAQPVRRQYSLKNVEKCLKTIKQTLQAYAFARPHIRLSLRVLKAKNDKGNWMYAPKPGGNAEDAAFKIVGAMCASQCDWSVLEEKGYIIEAFLPRADADAQKVSNIGAFVSVDGRPVSVARGTFKQLVKIFRDALRKSNAVFENIKDSFLYMSLQCPSASYDPNVEPAKDDLLFEDPEDVINLACKLFGIVYPSIPAESKLRNMNEADGLVPRVKAPTTFYEEDDFVTSLEMPTDLSVAKDSLNLRTSCSRSRLPETPAPTSEARFDSLDEPPSAEHGIQYSSNMYGADDDDVYESGLSRHREEHETDEDERLQVRKDIKLHNPWVTAKLNAPLRPSLELEAASARSLAEIEASSSSLQRLQQPMMSSFTEHQLPTPRPSSLSPPHDEYSLSEHALAWQEDRSAHNAKEHSSFAGEPLVTSALAHHRQQLQQPDQSHGQYLLQSSPPQGTPLHAIPTSSAKAKSGPRKAQQTRINKPFVMPLPDHGPREKTWFDHLENIERSQARKHRSNRQVDTTGLVQQGELGDLLNEPRPLTPPRGNRDIRDFVGTVDMTDGGMSLSRLECHTIDTPPIVCSRDDQAIHTTPDNALPGKAVRYGGAFMPTSELAAISAHMDQSAPPNGRPSSRHGVSEGRALREISSNARGPTTSKAAQRREPRNTGEPTIEDSTKTPETRAAASDGEQDYRPKPDGRSTSRRRASTTQASKRRRTNTARLPLERTPAGRETYHLAHNRSESIHDISRSAAGIDGQRSLLKWNEPAISTITAFTVPADDNEIVSLTAKLHRLLVDRVSDGEMVQDLGELVQRVFMARADRDEGAMGGIQSTA